MLIVCCNAPSAGGKVLTYTEYTVSKQQISTQLRTVDNGTGEDK